MPCLTKEREYLKLKDSMERLSREMCSTPLPPMDDEDEDEGIVSASPSKFNGTDDDAFDEYYHKILDELEKCVAIKKRRDQELHRLSCLHQNDRTLDKWDNFKSETDEFEDTCSLQRDIVELRQQLLDISTKMPNMAFQMEDKFQLERNIQIVTNELDRIDEKKKLISDYNVRAHRLLTDSKYSPVSLKDNIKELYRICGETHQKVLQQLTTLRHTLLIWSQFDMHMLELKTVLREDHTALNVLDKALKQEEYVGEDMAFPVKNIVKYLPERHHDNLIKVNNNNVNALDSDQIDSMSVFFMNTLNVEGSLSDSGISDSGSEHDLCEREKRLALLKKLARHLESVLAPGCEALRNMLKRIDEAEEEIKELQQTCRKIMKTGYQEQEDQASAKTDKILKLNFRNEQKITKKTRSDDPESDPGKGRSIFWRVLRAALPFHMAIVVLLCVACLLEPNCCDAINNLNLSLTPQLRYISGPPPT